MNLFAARALGWVNGQQVGPCTFEIESQTDTIQFTSDVRPDPTWSHIDTAGHFHAFDDKGETPTLVSVLEDTYYCGSCNDEHEERSLRCVECREVVTPARKDRGPGQHVIEVSRNMTVVAPAAVAGESASVRLVFDDGTEMFGMMMVGERTIGNDCNSTTLYGQLHSRMTAEDLRKRA